MLGRVKSAAVRHVKPRVPETAWDALRRLGGSVSQTPEDRERRRLRSASLTELAIEFKTDKWGPHSYTPLYERHLAHLKDEEFVLLELGIGGYRRTGDGGASLRMWKQYFPRARIVGVDIEDKRFVNEPRITAHRGSQTDRALLERIVARHGRPLVVVDDGSHRPEHVRESFDILFPMLLDAGVYAIEDTQTSYWPDWGGSLDLAATHTTMDLVKRRVDGLNHAEFLPAYEPSYADLHVVAVHCYHNLVFVEKGDNDVVSRQRRAANPGYFRPPE